jgi:hypothetical protein
MRTASLLALAVLALPQPSLSTEPGAAARAHVGALAHDLGEVTPGDVAAHAFAIENQGTAALTLTLLSYNGPCAIEGLDASIAPGATGHLKVSMETATLTKPTRCGFRVASNDPERATLDFELYAAQRTAIKAKPGQARFQYVQGEQTGTIRQVLWAADAAPFEVLAVSAPEQLTTSFRRAAENERKADQPGEQWVVEVGIRGDAGVGPIEGAVEVRTTHPAQKVFRLPVSGFVRPVLHVTPPAGRVTDLELGREIAVGFTVRNFATEPIHLLEATSSMPGTRAEIVPREEGRSWDLRVILTPQMGSGEFSGKVTVRTDSPKVPQLEVPLSGTVTVPASAAVASTGG